MINKDVYTITFPGQVDEDASQRSHPMNRLAALAVGALLLSTTPALAQVPPFPASFRTTTIAANGAQLHVRIGGRGPAVVLLHGYGETGDMWSPLAKALAANHTVIVPDLRGMGLSNHPPAATTR
jgi:cephalosporin-C deacetylase-like acetyl esterase